MHYSHILVIQLKLRSYKVASYKCTSVKNFCTWVLCRLQTHLKPMNTKGHVLAYLKVLKQGWLQGCFGSGVQWYLWVPLACSSGVWSWVGSILQQPFFCDYKLPAAASASSLKPRLSLTAQTKILELNLLGSDWPDLGHMPTIEPITGVQQLHALPMLGERTGNTPGLRTIHGLCIEEERMDAVETRCRGGAWEVQRETQNGKPVLQRNTSATLVWAKVTFLFEEFQHRPLMQTGSSQVSFCRSYESNQCLLQLLTSVSVCSDVTFPLWKKSSSSERLLNIQITGREPSRS